MLRIFLQAPFAACRTFTAGWHRPSATFLTPSAVYGLLMNVAGIETRVLEHDDAHDGSVPASLMRTDLPEMSLAIGAAAQSRIGGQVMSLEESLPTVQSVFQQLHNYPVGKDAGMAPEFAKGNKNNISPVRREFLSDLRVTIHVKVCNAVQDRICENLSATVDGSGRYGLPFLGDNQFLIDRLEIIPEPITTYWFTRLADSDQVSLNPRTVRLTTWIDRADMSKTTSTLYAPTEIPVAEAPDAAWTSVGPGMAERKSN